MRLTYPIRVLSGTTQPDPNDNPVFMPPTVQPVFEYPGPVRGLIPANAPTAQQETFLTSTTAVQGPSTGAYAQSVVPFKAGLWRCNIELDVISDFSTGPGTGGGNTIALFNPAGGSVTLIVLVPTANVPQHVVRDFLLNLPTDGFFLGLSGVATIAAQNWQMSFSGIFSRLG